MRIAALTAAILLSSIAFAAEPAPKKEPAKESKDGKGKAKIGEACKATSDCDSSRPVNCVNGKCEAQVVHPPT